jgi:hypothetical protein
MHASFNELRRRLAGRSPIDVKGVPCTIILVAVQEPLLPTETHVDVRLEAEYEGRHFRGELHLGRDRLHDLQYVEDVSVETMRRIVTGDLPPGAMDLV